MRIARVMRWFHLPLQSPSVCPDHDKARRLKRKPEMPETQTAIALKLQGLLRLESGALDNRRVAHGFVFEERSEFVGRAEPRFDPGAGQALTKIRRGHRLGYFTVEARGDVSRCRRRRKHAKPDRHHKVVDA